MLTINCKPSALGDGPALEERPCPFPVRTVRFFPPLILPPNIVIHIGVQVKFVYKSHLNRKL